MTDLSIIVVTYNAGDFIIDCLRSLIPALPVPEHAKILVIDNASHDGTPEHVAETFPHIRLIRNPENRGFAAANNQGLALTTGRYIVLLNPDVVVQPDALSLMADFLDQHPNAGIAGPRMLTGDGMVALTAYPPYSVGVILWQYLGLARVFPYAVFGRYRRQCEQAVQPFPVGWVQGSCFMLRREVYEQIGGLDEELFLFAEEPDYCDRAQQAGWETYYVPAAVVTHYESSSVSRFHDVRVRHYHLSPLHYFRKRGKGSAVLALKVGFSLELLAKIGVRLVQGLWDRSKDTASRIRAYRLALGEMWRY